ncbi:radical SAM protein [Peredibacter sp. HCB2-198]|uniref:radical SAM protein n=1 Tax=Peredibacter sp. HCB2-198 TaxID=3383025 RepID=UPI0038B59868
MQYVDEVRNNEGRRGSFNLEITTTALCDLSCTYCFEGEKVDKRRLDNDLPVIFKRIDSLLENKEWFQHHYDMLNISFWGGEPTLNPKFIIEIMNKYKDEDRIDFHLYTNAFNIHNMNKILDNVDTSKLHIQVSYDGKLINDKYRITKNKTITSNQVLNNLYLIAQRGVSVNVKSTLPIENMETLSSTWLEFRDIQSMLSKVNPKLRVNYAPTIDYVTKVSKEEKDSALKVFREEFLKIAKYEIEFFKQNGRHLCSWFGGSDNRKHCSAGMNMAAIDQAGDLFACHGAIYSSKKDELKSTNITDDDFVEKLKTFSQGFEKPTSKIAKDCVDCVATTCMMCPVASHEKSEKEDFYDRWLDNWSNNLCGFFKTFGEIDRAVQEINSRSMNGL